MGMLKVVPQEQSSAGSVAAAVSQGIPVTEVEQNETKAVKPLTVVAAMRAGFNQPLTEYDLRKDKQIGVAGVVQAVLGSDWYGQQAMLTDLSNKDSVKALREFALEEVTYWLGVIKSKSEEK